MTAPLNLPALTAVAEAGRSLTLAPHTMSAPDLAESLRWIAGCLANGPLNPATAKQFAATLTAHAETVLVVLARTADLAQATRYDAGVAAQMEARALAAQPLITAALAWFDLHAQDVAYHSDAEAVMLRACDTYRREGGR